MILYIILALLWLLETRPIYSIVKLIFIFLGISVYIHTYINSYISYLFIIIYLSALIILFSLVLMLPYNNKFNDTTHHFTHIWYILLLLLFYLYMRNDIYLLLFPTTFSESLGSLVNKLAFYSFSGWFFINTIFIIWLLFLVLIGILSILP